jgi:hypothetical protein
MKLCALLSFSFAIVAASLCSESSAETVQTAANVFHGSPFLYVEAESASTITGTAGSTWKVANKGGPDMSFIAAGSGGTSVPIVPTTSNASGGSVIWAPVNDFSSHVPTAQYQLKFVTPGTYQFFLRQSLFDNNNNGSLLNEDSIFIPPGFNKNSGTDWVGAAHLDFDETDTSVDVPTPGYALDPDGYKPSVGNHDRDGLLELQNWGIKDKGTVTFATPSGSVSTNGHYDWYNRPTTQGINATGGFESFFGMKTELEVTPAMVGQTVTFELGLREVNVAIDGFLFIQTSNIYPDQDVLDLYTQAELDAGVLPQPVSGDYNGNGSVDAADYVAWRKGGTLVNEVDAPGTVNAADYDAWRARFGNPSGSGLGAAAIPEPTTAMLLLLSLAAFQLKPRRK